MKSITEKKKKSSTVALGSSPLPYLSDNKEMNDILKVMEKLLHWAAIIDSSDDAIISKSLDGQITSWNKGAQLLYGYTPEEVIGQPVAMLMPPEREDDFPRIMSMLQRGEKVDHYETKRITKDGRIIDVAITVSPIRDSRGNMIGASKIARDISARTEYERRRDNFISTASHELKTPLTTQKIYGELLEEKVAKNGHDEYLPAIRKMNAQTDKLTKLVNDLLQVSRIQSGMLILNCKEFVFADMLSDVLREMQPTCLHPISLIEPYYQGELVGDEERLSQVFVNLISNAIKYSPASTPIVLSCQKMDDQVVIKVQDFGIGISKEMQPRIFERFYRASGADEATYPGMGIGLNICYEVVALHEGVISVQSQPGQGSTFTVSLPLSGPKAKNLSDE